MNFIRVLFCIYNFIFLLLGAIVLGFGIWIAADQKFAAHLEKLIEEADANQVNETIISVVKSSGYILIAFGGLIFFLSFLGYCGAIKESRFLLGLYTFLLGLILLLEIIALILILAVFGPKLEEETQKFLVEKLKSKYEYPSYPNIGGDEHQGFARVLDGIMVKFECCGIANSSDFTSVRVPPNQPSGTKVPITCCQCENVNECQKLPEFPTSADISKIRLRDCRSNPGPDNSNVNNPGCYVKLRDKLLSGERKSIGVVAGIVILLVQLIGLIFGIYTYKKAFNSY